jgi:uncharacterized protein (DUF302 family)
VLAETLILASRTKPFDKLRWAPTTEAVLITTKHINVQRFSITCSRKFQEIVAALQGAVGHPDMARFQKNLAEAKTCAELEEVVHAAVGPSELMEFARMDLGEVLRKRNGKEARNSLRLILGNPLIMCQMLEHVPDAGSYAPVTILIDERQDGVHLSYDRMASFLAPYGSVEALKVATDLDSKVEALLTAVAGD